MTIGNRTRIIANQTSCRKLTTIRIWITAAASHADHCTGIKNSTVIVADQTASIVTFFIDVNTLVTSTGNASRHIRVYDGTMITSCKTTNVEIVV